MFAISRAQRTSTPCRQTVCTSKSCTLPMFRECSVVCSTTCTNAPRLVTCLSRAACGRCVRDAKAHVRRTFQRPNYVLPNLCWCAVAWVAGSSSNYLAVGMLLALSWEDENAHGKVERRLPLQLPSGRTRTPCRTGESLQCRCVMLMISAEASSVAVAWETLEI